MGDEIEIKVKWTPKVKPDKPEKKSKVQERKQKKQELAEKMDKIAKSKETGKFKKYDKDDWFKDRTKEKKMYKIGETVLTILYEHDWHDPTNEYYEIYEYHEKKETNTMVYVKRIVTDKQDVNQSRDDDDDIEGYLYEMSEFIRDSKMRKLIEESSSMMTTRLEKIKEMMLEYIK